MILLHLQALPNQSTIAMAPVSSDEQKQLDSALVEPTIEQECPEYASDTAATQNMPEHLGDPCGDSLMEEVVEQVGDVNTAQTLDGLDEISPTLPFKAQVPEEDDNLEISPTLPFQAVVDQSSPHELEISPTLPFDIKAGQSTLESQASPEKETSQIASDENPLQGEDLPANRARDLKRPASLMSEPSGSGDEGQDDDAMSNAQDAAEDAERLRREQEWLRHKRRSLRQEMMGKQKDEASRAKKTARRAQRAAAQGTTTMTGEDRHRYAALVADGSKASTLAELKEQDADDDIIADHRRGTATRRQTVFATGNVGATSA